MSTGPDSNTLRLFLDSADAADWNRWLPQGCFYGITTNPLLLQRAAQPCTVANLARIASQVRELGAREIQMQVWGDSAETMLRCGQELSQLQSGTLAVVVKVPITAAGLTAAKRLTAAGVRVTMTAVFTPGQVMLAAGLGAAYAAPYLGRMLDAGEAGREQVLKMAAILRQSGRATRLLVASLRDARQVVDLASQGLDTFTFGPGVAEQLLQAELTSTAVAQFEAAARDMGASSA